MIFIWGWWLHLPLLFLICAILHFPHVLLINMNYFFIFYMGRVLFFWLEDVTKNGSLDPIFSQSYLKNLAFFSKEEQCQA